MNTELFNGKAEAYAAARPGYPDAAIEYVLSLVSPNAVFADIGAGTGKFTREIAKRGYNIFAVEPNTDMLAQLASLTDEFTNVKIISASAEKTTLPDSSVDVITCAQALHWFDPVAFMDECRRIGKPSCIVIAVYNNTPGGSSISHSKNSTEIFFKDPTVREFPNPILYTREKWLTYMTSHSHAPLQSDPNFDAHIAEMNKIFDEESSNGFLQKNIITKVYSEVSYGRSF
ncbi:MAG: class I SAM-dependent methyltransferase [Defluviitaleaceae bacterium]|nr:class I SAM-dependent methyltransferase [Defluviitaleaceae bacterium]